jgi:hypothetical protein
LIGPGRHLAWHLLLGPQNLITGVIRRRGRVSMSMSFLPSRDNMIKEIDQWIVLQKLDMLVGLCNCCMYKVFAADHECRSCRVKSGIRRIVRSQRREPVEGEELLGVC